MALQGAVTEHIEAVKRALRKLDIRGEVVPIRGTEELEAVDGLIIPGGESTTISRLLDKAGMQKLIRKRAQSEMPILGTCAGCVLLAKQGDLDVEKTDTKLLSLMDMKVNRNAFGRQRESFETLLEIKGFKAPYKAVFIRAPAIERVWGECEGLASVDDKIVLARQGNLVAVAFHPELTDDTRIHGLLLKMIIGDDF